MSASLRDDHRSNQYSEMVISAEGRMFDIIETHVRMSMADERSTTNVGTQAQ